MSRREKRDLAIPTRSSSKNKSGGTEITADFIVIATGSVPARPENVPFSPDTIVCSDTILDIQEFPESLIVVGGGLIGTEYATIAATAGINVTLIDGRDNPLSFVDAEILAIFQNAITRSGVASKFGAGVDRIEEVRSQNGMP